MSSDKTSVNKSSKSGRRPTVTFQFENSNKSVKKLKGKRSKRKKIVEPTSVPEIRLWSSLIALQSAEQIGHDIDQQSMNTWRNPYLQEITVDRSLALRKERSNRIRSTLIDRNKSDNLPDRILTCRSFCGTMSNINEIFINKRFLRRLPWLKSLIIFIDSCLRGIGQVMFANNPITGLIITIGLLIGQWDLALYGLLGTIISTLVAHLLGVDSNTIRAGLYGYNGCLTGLAITFFTHGLHFLYMIGAVVLMSACSTILFAALSNILAIRLGLSPFGFPFQICTFLWLLTTSKFRYFYGDELVVPSGSLSIIVGQTNLLNVTNLNYTILDILTGCMTSISQLYFMDNVLVSIIILMGLTICSPILSIFALFGGITGQLTAVYFLRVSSEEIRQGLWAFNSVLVCQVLGGMFYVLTGFRIWLFTIFGSVMTVLTQVALLTLFNCSRLPSITLPATIICWLFCLIGVSSKHMVGVKLQSISVPEDHLRRFRLKNFVKMRFEFLKNLSTILEKTGQYEDISTEDLATIENEFIPILLCSYTHQNDIENLKRLLHKGANINSTDYDLRSPLHLAACDGNFKLSYKFIKNYRANVNLIDAFGGTPLYDAFCHGNFHIIPFLYAQGARMPLEKTKELIFYLCAFSFEGNLEAVQYLIACGVNPNLTDYNGRTALHLAVSANQFPIVQFLVEIGNTSLSIVDHYGQTPIDEALRLADKSIANYLQQQRISSSKGKLGNIIIKTERCSETSDFDDDDDDQDDLDKLVDNSPTNVEKSLLPALFCMAAAEGNLRQMENILQQFPEFTIDSVDYDFRSAAHVAASEGQLFSIQYLCEYSYSKTQNLNWINKEDRWGRTPIEEAYRHGHFQVANYLKQRITQDLNKDSLEIEQTTLSSSSSNTLMDSLKKWKKILYFATLASKNEFELIKGLLESGVFSSLEFYTDYDGRTPMHLAAANGHLDVVKILQYYGDDGRTYRDRWANSALDEARRKKFDQIIYVLLDDIV